MNEQLRILILEDNDADADLIEHELRKANIAFSSKRAKTKEAFLMELREFSPGLILADYTLPGYDGCSALKIVKEKCPDIPFIFVSGTIGEDFAIESLKNGATDYVIKERMARLGPAVLRALSDMERKTENQRAEKALKESELRFRSLVQSANEAIILTDGVGHIISWNKGAEAIFGYAQEEVLSMTIMHIMPDRYRSDHIMRLKFVSLTGKPDINGKTVEAYGLRKDGAEFPIEISIATWKIENEVFYSGIIRDITGRKMAEAEKERFLNAFASSNDGIAIANEDDRYIYINTTYAMIFGYTQEELIGDTWRKITPPEMIPAIEKGLDATLHKKDIGAFNGEAPGLRKDGTTVPIEVRGRGLWDEKGNYYGHICIVRDITERKKAEEELKIKAQLLDDTTDSIFVHDLAGNFIYLNEGAYKSRGFGKEEMMGMNLRDILVPEYARMIDSRFNKLLEKGEATFESAHIRKDGSVFPAEAHARIIESGGRKLVLSVIRDITERKRAEEFQKERARVELYGFIVSALPLFASGVSSHVRDILVCSFTDRFEKNVRMRFEEEMELMGLGRDSRATAAREEVLNYFLMWLSELFNNFGIRTGMKAAKNSGHIEFTNCSWLSEARRNPIFCLICRAMVIRSFSWTSLKGSASQSSSIAEGSRTCKFEIRLNHGSHDQEIKVYRRQM